MNSNHSIPIAKASASSTAHSEALKGRKNIAQGKRALASIALGFVEIKGGRTQDDARYDGNQMPRYRATASDPTLLGMGASGVNWPLQGFGGQRLLYSKCHSLIPATAIQ